MNLSTDHEATRMWERYERLVREKRWDFNGLFEAFVYRTKSTVEHILDLFKYFKKLLEKFDHNEIMNKIKGNNLVTELDVSF